MEEQRELLIRASYILVQAQVLRESSQIDLPTVPCNLFFQFPRLDYQEPVLALDSCSLNPFYEPRYCFVARSLGTEM